MNGRCRGAVTLGQRYCWVSGDLSIASKTIKKVLLEEALQRAVAEQVTMDAPISTVHKAGLVLSFLKGNNGITKVDLEEDPVDLRDYSNSQMESTDSPGASAPGTQSAASTDSRVHRPRAPEGHRRSACKTSGVVS